MLAAGCSQWIGKRNVIGSVSICFASADAGQLRLTRLWLGYHPAEGTPCSNAGWKMGGALLRSRHAIEIGKRLGPIGVAGVDQITLRSAHGKHERIRPLEKNDQFNILK